MTYEEAYLYMKETGKRGSIYGTETVKELLLRLGNPQDRVPVVHIAGTNGKGSIFAFVGHILEDAGYVVGRYISPTIFTYLERFQINGHYMKESEFARIMETVIPVCEDMEEAGLPIPTAFELETAVAFLYFVQKKGRYRVTGNRNGRKERCDKCGETAALYRACKHQQRSYAVSW